MCPISEDRGLGDVIGALPAALKPLGIEARVMPPLYDSIPDRYRSGMKEIARIQVPVGWRNAYCGIMELEYDGVTYYFLDNEQYFKEALPTGTMMTGNVSHSYAERRWSPSRQSDFGRTSSTDMIGIPV